MRQKVWERDRPRAEGFDLSGWAEGADLLILPEGRLLVQVDEEVIQANLALCPLEMHYLVELPMEAQPPVLEICVVDVTSGLLEKGLMDSKKKEKILGGRKIEERLRCFDRSYIHGHRRVHGSNSGCILSLFLSAKGNDSKSRMAIEKLIVNFKELEGLVN
jgi:hypothetical protein